MLIGRLTLMNFAQPEMFTLEITPEAVQLQGQDESTLYLTGLL